jgi:hypothetical protein
MPLVTIDVIKDVFTHYTLNVYLTCNSRSKR